MQSADSLQTASDCHRLAQESKTANQVTSDTAAQSHNYLLSAILPEHAIPFCGIAPAEESTDSTDRTDIDVDSFSAFSFLVDRQNVCRLHQKAFRRFSSILVKICGRLFKGVYEHFNESIFWWIAEMFVDTIKKRSANFHHNTLKSAEGFLIESTHIWAIHQKMDSLKCA